MKKFLLLPLLLSFILLQSAYGAPEENLTVTGPVAEDKISFQPIEEGKMLVSVTDKEERPRLGLKAKDFSIQRMQKKAKILTVEPLTTDKEVGLHIVMVVDNSQSMQMRNAVKPLLQALEAFYETIRSIDTISVVVYDAKNTIDVDGRPMHAKTLQSNNPGELRTYLKRQMTKGITGETFLYDAMMVGIDQVRQWPQKSNKFMVVFSDGEDINSSVKDDQVMAAAKGVPNFAAYCVDFMPAKTTDKFLKAFALDHSGYIWKAQSASELLPIFKNFSSTLLHRYVVSYRFLNPPTASLAFTPGETTIEEVTTIDSSPLLNYLFFDAGQSELPDRYLMFKERSQTETFSAKKLTGGMEKYRHVLNIIGHRMRKHPEAAITLVGCNSNTGEEYKRSDLSRSRSESVRSYLRYVWGIAPERMAVESRNLPEVPSTNRIPEGQAENQRVEIRSDHPALLDTVKSQYVEKVSDIKQIEVTPTVSAEAGIETWQITLKCDQQTIATFEGQGDLAPSYALPLEKKHLDIMAAAGKVTASLHVTDKENKVLVQDDAATMPVRFVQRQEQLAQRQGYKVLEKYALILFDYDSDAIKERNQTIVQRIIKRLKDVPRAAVDIVGHTDNIGKVGYNLQLSEKRAEAVRGQFSQIQEAIEGSMRVAGAGPHNPLYDNLMPEGRALNRTVTVALEYESR